MINTLVRNARLVVLLCCTTTSLLTAQQESELLQRADKQFNLYAYNLALQTYQSALAQSPNNAYILSRIGDCHYQLNRPQDALSWYDKAANIGTVDPQVYIRYGKALMQTADYTGAKKWFQYANQGITAPIAQHFASMCDYAMTASNKDALYQVRNEIGINTEAADYLPAFYGSNVVFSSARNDKKRNSPGKSAQDWSGSANNQLFAARRANNSMLKDPEFLRSDLENGYNEGPVSFSANARRVAFCRNNFIDGARQVADRGVNLSLYTGDIQNGNWTNIKPFAYNGSDFSTGFPCLSADGNTLWFASNDPNGSMGGWDIYVSYWISGNWSTPRNLGSPVNTPGNEVTPFIDGSNLYFSSDWHRGFGGLDVFRADMNNDTPTNVYHLGPGINSPRDDYGFIFNPSDNSGYMTSNRTEGNKGKEDIWQVRKRADEFVISVTDERLVPLSDAQIDFSTCGAGTKNTDREGKYAFSVTSGKADCRITVRKNGYSTASAAVQSNGTKAINLVLYSGNQTPPATYSTTPSTPVTNTQPSNNSPIAEPVQYNTTGRSEFTVFVTDGAQNPIPNAEVDFSECGAGTKYTDAQGRYAFAVNNTISCRITVRKGGYISTMVPVRSNGSKTISAILLDARGFDETMTADVKNNNSLPERPNTYSTPSTTPAKPLNNNTELVFGQTQPTAPTAPVNDFVPTVDGFAIQLAASPEKFSQAKMAKYQDLAPYGNLYVKPEGKTQKLRLGVYPKREDAEEVYKIVRAKHKDAFVLQEKDADARLAVKVVPEADRPATYSTNSKNKPSNVTVVAPITYNKVEEPKLHFSIHVASFTPDQPSPLNTHAALMPFGNLYTKAENGLTKVRLGVWTKYADAETALRQVVAQGYPQATIVTDKASDETKGLIIASATPAPAAQEEMAPVVYSTATASTNKGSKVKETKPAKPATADRPVVYSTTSTTEPEKPVPYATPASKLDKEPGRYFVRICSVTTDPRMFDKKKAERAGGKVETRPGANGSTVMLLGGFSDLAEVHAANLRLIDLGYKDAYVVKETEDMVLRRIQL
jgi:Tetratricopeptide repeat/WD40-like Beta Propeller Repeat